MEEQGVDGGKRAYGTCREWGPRKGEIIWNVNKKYIKKKKKKMLNQLKKEVETFYDRIEDLCGKYFW